MSVTDKIFHFSQYPCERWPSTLQTSYNPLLNFSLPTRGESCTVEGRGPKSVDFLMVRSQRLTSSLPNTRATMLAILTGTFGATTPPHRITELPGWEAPLTTEHWSGFVEVDKASGTHLFYVLAMSAHSPSTDPIVWWMNGGPGASSLAGMFGENGPLLLAGDSKTLFPNPYA